MSATTVIDLIVLFALIVIIVVMLEVNARRRRHERPGPGFGPADRDEERKWSELDSRRASRRLSMWKKDPPRAEDEEP